MPGLYDISSNANVTVGNTTGLYIGSGNIAVVNSAGQLIGILSNSASVGFYLTNANTNVSATVLASGVGAGTYGNATSIPVVTVGSDGRITGITTSNISIPSGNIQLIGNVTGSGTIGSPINTFISASGVGAGSYGNTAYYPTFTVGSDGRLTVAGVVSVAAAAGTYSNVNVAAYLSSGTDSTINAINANVTGANAAQIAANTIQSNQIAALTSGLAGANAAIVTANTIQSGQINATNANIGSFYTWANANFGTSNYANANVTAYLATASINTSGTIQAANLITTAGVYWANGAPYSSGSAGGVTQIVAGTNVTVSPAGGTGVVTVTANTQPGTYSNANVASYLPVYSGNLTAGNLVLSGNLTVNGTTTTINSTEITIDDKNITLGSVATPTDAGADGGGLTLKGTTDKTFNWVDATDAWTSSEHINLASGKAYYLNGTALKDAAETLTNKTISGANNTLTVRIANDVSGLGTGVATFLATPSSANLASALTDETGSNTLVFSNSPTLVTPTLGAATATSIAFANSFKGSATATAGTSATTIDTFAAATYTAAKYVVQMKHGSDVEVIEVLVAVDGANNVYVTEYADVQSNGSLGTVDAVYTGGNVLLQVTAAAASTDVKLDKTYIKA